MKKIGTVIDQLKVKETTLKKAYVKALTDDNFNRLIKSLHLPEEYLMKYTSKLTVAALERNNCKHCDNLLTCKNSIIGFIYTPVITNNSLLFSYIACPFKQKMLKETDYQNYVYNVDIPKEIRTASMKNIYKDDASRLEIVAWLKNFLDQYSLRKKTKGLYLSGPFGSGKTYLIAAMFNELAKKKVDSAIIYWPEYLRSLKASFKDNFKEHYTYIQKIPLLLIDDIGAESVTSWSRDEILGSLLQYRMQEELPTFFTSNLNITDLEKHFSISTDHVDIVKARRIIERIKQLTICKEMISKNRRN